ncbi:hypothetical protein KsCSTR_39250 [Candidatus Kuenenia stuttgartiensis]|uniref:Uncharacterized protein n=1 Tax=Kuenenia stuttgartiensis TaxID=174633 RepID=A0A6G7GVF8_KUEST|nr:hypothetical protein KsCSTR_39250 [Candidatus Kuenenia stuttgartiensis]
MLWLHRASPSATPDKILYKLGFYLKSGKQSTVNLEYQIIRVRFPF